MKTNKTNNEDNIRKSADATRSLVPPHRFGKAIDAQSSALLSTEKTAAVFYELVKNRLQHVNSWSNIAGVLSAEFQLVNKEGIEVYRKAQEGDYIRIDIIGPGGKSGNGYDWVRIEQVGDGVAEGNAVDERFGFRVRPASHPMANRPVPDHFYDDDSTSTFQVFRKGDTVTASVSDRNTGANEDATNVVDRIRNNVVARVALARISEIQWQSLVDGLVSR